jgi:hypothetical protein
MDVTSKSVSKAIHYRRSVRVLKALDEKSKRMHSFGDPSTD